MQVEDRDSLGHGYHLRSMTCADPIQSEFHDRRNNELLGKFLTPANVTFTEMFPSQNFYVEKFSGETHVTVFVQMVDTDNWEADIDTKTICIEDAETGDRYMCRHLIMPNGVGTGTTHQNSRRNNIHIVTKGYHNMYVQFTYVFPPLDKHVRLIRIGNPNDNAFHNHHPVHRLKDVLRKPKRIIE